MLKLILSGIVLLVIVLLVAALFVGKSYTVQREITINKPKAEVFGYLKHLRNQDNFSKWVMTDPNMQKSFRGTDGTVGFVYGWNGNDQAGEGEQEIISLTEGERMEVEIRFKRPFKGIAHAPFTTETVGPYQTKVKWGMTGGNPYPFNLMHLFTDKLLGKDLEISLGNLKQILEKEPVQALAK